jgi:tetratricopeptide (TPR) repeat protein
VNLGLLERQQGRIDAALAAFERAAAVSSAALEGPYLLAETLLATGRRQQAEKWAAEALRRSPADPRAQELVRRIRGN